MIEAKLEKFVPILLIFIEFVIGSNFDGFCTFSETYIDAKPQVETYTEKIQVSKKCGLLYLSTCYETQTVQVTHRPDTHAVKMRLKKQCCPGYVTKEDKCIPKCLISCKNSQCTGPDTCTCDAGYIPSISRYRCNPKCKEGYTYNTQSTDCDPVCTKPCTNGVCSGPELCKCSSGYHKNDKDICVEDECSPSITLSDKCRNGTCTSNGVCQCNLGFAKNISTVECLPICDECKNGHCIAPNTCSCFDGFEWNTAESKCVPKCTEACLNGDCMSPEKCICRPGYTTFNSSVCSPVCKEDCVNGRCTDPNKCTCAMGYQFRQESDHVCDPICQSGCLNGNCVKPNLCHCDKGFLFNEKSKVCEPVCEKECVNSKCSAPNICTCEPGFTALNTTHCVVPCENCSNGYCEESNVCQCDVGYHMSVEENICIDNECNITVNNNCENGYCSNGVCLCDSGYRRNTSTACIPVCSLDCVNGYCSEPEVCDCNHGYVMDTSNRNICSKVDDDPSIIAAQENESVRIASSHNSLYFWIIGIGIIVSTLCATSVVVYVKYFRRISYRCNSSDLKVIYYEDDQDEDNFLRINKDY